MTTAADLSKQIVALIDVMQRNIDLLNRLLDNINRQTEVNDSTMTAIRSDLASASDQFNFIELKIRGTLLKLQRPRSWPFPNRRITHTWE